MKIFSVLILSLAAFFLFRSCFGEKRKQESLKDLLAPTNSESRALKESLEKILPTMVNKRSIKDQNLQGSENVVVIKHGSNHLDLIDVIERIHVLAKRPDNEGLDFLQWFIRSDSYTDAEKAEALRETAGVIPKNDLKNLVGNILIHMSSPSLQLESLRVLGDVLGKEEMQSFVRSLERELRNERSKEVLNDFSAESGF